MANKAVGIVGSYRKGGVVDRLVTEVLNTAKNLGMQTEKIYLTDVDIKFCTNCRRCTQQQGENFGECIHNDDMRILIEKCINADAIVIGAPVNCFNITAVTRRFMERLVCLTYWPWGRHYPINRIKSLNKKSVLITSSAMPSFMGYMFTGAIRALKVISKLLGAKPIKVIYAGKIATFEHEDLSDELLKNAIAAGNSLVS